MRSSLVDGGDGIALLHIWRSKAAKFGARIEKFQNICKISALNFANTSGSTIEIEKSWVVAAMVKYECLFGHCIQRLNVKQKVGEKLLKAPERFQTSSAEGSFESEIHLKCDT